MQYNILTKRSTKGMKKTKHTKKETTIIRRKQHKCFKSRPGLEATLYPLVPVCVCMYVYVCVYVRQYQVIFVYNSWTGG